MWMYETPITCEDLATTPCPLDQLFNIHDLVYVHPGNVKVVSKECPFGKLRLCDDEDLCELFLVILVESNLRQPLDTSFLYGIAPLHGNGIILDLSQYCLHQTAPSSLIEDDITAQKQKGSQLDVFLYSHPSATRDMQWSWQPMLSQSLPWKSPGIPRAVSVSRGDNTCRWQLMYSCDYPDSC